MKPTSNPLQLNLQAAESREVEVLGEGWELLTFDCLGCGTEGALQVKAHFTAGRSDEMIAVTKECPHCGIPVETYTDEV